MKKKVATIAIICLIMAIIVAVGSASNSYVELEEIARNNVEKTVPIENTGLERYIWFNGDREEQVFAALDEVAIFPKSVSETTNVTEELVKNFDQQAILIKDYEFVILVRLPPNRLDITTLEDKQDKFQNTTGNIANFVFYLGPEKDQAPMALTGDIIVHFRQDWDEDRIAEWAKGMSLETIESFPFSPNTYLFKAGPGLRSLDMANQIYLSGEVIYAYPNWWRTLNTRAIPDDPLFPDQWHLNNTGQGGGTSGEDVNITSVWDSYRGSANEVIAIVDDGLELLHEDLSPNILSGYSWDYVGNDPDPTAGDHGTSVAGVAAARGWNGLGVTGAAPSTKLIGYRLLGAGTDANEASALSNNTQIVDIYSNSWGPWDDRRLEGPGPLTQAALNSATANGRGGKGNIYVWAGGNGNDMDNENFADNSNYDGYANSRYVMAIAASNNTGGLSKYSEHGANIIVNTPSSNTLSPNDPDWTVGITTTDRTGALGYDNGNYTSTFGGTSSATPLASGIISLMFQANPDLTWRDVRLILAKTAEKNDPTDADWTTNGAGYHINHKYGFGRIDAYAAISTAANWTSVRPEVTVAASNSPNSPIPDNDAAGVSDTINITQNISIEFVEIYFTAADHTYWGDLEIELISPLGTKSILAKRHMVANSAQRYDNWTFGSVRHLGESSQGTWQLTVRDKLSGDTGTFQRWGLKIYGSEDPISRGLQYLRTTQNPDGSWSNDVGITSLAALSLLNAGYDETDPDVYDAISYIRSKVQGDGSIWSSGSKTYHTSLATLALVATHNASYDTTINNAAQWLKDSQWDEDCLWGSVNKDSWYYGGFGYGRNVRPDNSNTQFALMALDAVQSISKDDLLWDKAQVFLARTQNRQEDVYIPDLDYTVEWNHGYNKYNDGGFVYYPGASLAGDVNSYGSMTGAGIWGLRLSNVDKDNPRVDAALDWVIDNYMMDGNPGMSNPGTFQYYYYLSMSKALTMTEPDLIDGHNWYQDLSDNLTALQKPEGYWVNDRDAWCWENNKDLVTSYAILSLQTRGEIPPDIQRLSWITFILHSSADLHVYDPLGRHIGMNYDTGEIEVQIPNATYTSNGEQNITIPGLETGNYRIVLIGTGTGEYTLDVTGGVGDAIVSDDSFTSTISEGEVHDANVNVAMITWLTIHVDEPEPTDAMVQSATGTGNVSFVSDSGTIEDLTALNESDLPEENTAIDFPHGLFGFNITGLIEGETVNVTINFPQDISTTTEYWKYHTPEGWYQIPMGSNDGDHIITIQLTDGGLGDDDGIANGVIVDQGGPGVSAMIPASIRIEPETLNLANQGVFTAYIQLPEDYNVSDINVSTVGCEGAPAVRGLVSEEDNSTYIAKFNRQELVNVTIGDAVELIVTGKLYDGTPFEGNDTIRVIDKGKGK